VFVAALLTLRAIGRARREVARLKAMQEAYRRERESTGP